MPINRTIGINDEVDEASSRQLHTLLGSLGCQADVITDPVNWLLDNPDGLALLSMASTPPSAVPRIRRIAVGAVIVLVAETAPTPTIYRAYLTAGATSVIPTDQSTPTIVASLSAALAGVAALPLEIAGALASRLEERPPHLQLTNREEQILTLLARGVSPPQIAVALDCSQRHLRRLMQRLYQALDVNNRQAATAKAARWGL